MPSDISIRVTDSYGVFLFETRQFLEIGNNPGLHYVLSCGKVGALTVTLAPDFNSLLPKDGRIHVMRSVNGGPAQREGESCYLIRRWDYTNDYTTVTALHANYLLWSRADLYTYVGYSRNTLPGDDLIKELWTNNFAGGISSLRSQNTAGTPNNTQADISAYVSVAANLSAAPTILKQFNWRSVGDVILEIEDASFLNGTYLTAEIVAPTEDTLELRTYTGQRGVDRRFSTGNGLLFVESRGNLANGILTVDATEEITFAYAGGADRDYGRSNEYAVDSTRMGESAFGRRELFVDSANTTSNADVQADADAGVRGGRPVITATGDLVDTDLCQRGVHYNYGDLVTVEVRGVQYDMRCDLIEVTLTGGVERTQSGFYYNG